MACMVGLTVDFSKWKLNALGFAAQPSSERNPQAPRAMVLGASETFGLYEAEGKEYGPLNSPSGFAAKVGPMSKS